MRKLAQQVSRRVKHKDPVSSDPRDAHIRTRLIHGVQNTGRWDYNHHVVPPITASATFRLESAARGALGFEEFVEDTLDPRTHPTIYIYDRLNEPTCGMLEDNLAIAECGEVAVCFASGMAAIMTAVLTITQPTELGTLYSLDEVKARAGANSGFYFHTAFQEKDWPSQGFSVPSSPASRART